MGRLRLAEGRRGSFFPGSAVSRPLSPECIFLPGHLICLVVSSCFLLLLGISKMTLSQEKMQGMEYSKGRGQEGASPRSGPHLESILPRLALFCGGESPALVPICLPEGRTGGRWGFSPAHRWTGVAVYACPGLLALRSHLNRTQVANLKAHKIERLLLAG